MPGVQGNMLHMLKYILINMIKSCIAIFFLVMPSLNYLFTLLKNL